MGEYIKNKGTGHELKIGVCESLWLTRDELIQYKESGYQGFYGEEYNDEIDLHLKEKTFFLSQAYTHTPEQQAKRKKALENQDIYEYWAQYPIRVVIELPKESHIYLEHSKIWVSYPTVTGRKERTSLQCPMHSEKTIHAVISKERYSPPELAPITVFSCLHCRAPFSLPKALIDTITLQEPHTELKHLIFPNEHKLSEDQV